MDVEPVPLDAEMEICQAAPLIVCDARWPAAPKGTDSSHARLIVVAVLPRADLLNRVVPRGKERKVARLHVIIVAPPAPDQ